MKKRKKITISVQLEPDLYNEFCDLAERSHRSLAQMMRYLVQREAEEFQQMKDRGDEK